MINILHHFHLRVSAFTFFCLLFLSPCQSFAPLYLSSAKSAELHKIEPFPPRNHDIFQLSAVSDDNSENISAFCKGTNNFWKKLVISPVRNYVEVRPAGTADKDIFSKLIAPPEVPGLPRPVWFTILGSVPTALGWYGYYKFSVEEELFQHELQTTGKVSGCGGYGTLFPFVYGIIVGFPLSLLHVPGGETIVNTAALWILLGQVNLYRRVNEIVQEGGGESPLHEWWALLPPPLDVVVGLRQVHFLSEYWRTMRGEPYIKDVVAEEWFPFISAPRFTLKEFARTPSMWFWFSKDWKDFHFDFLKD
uniref:Uncharacterized protein n=1 Tax=Corethron hystrix TaxID=216773 RepID=A0A7S1FLV1_9STRA|mmetsp:Transcript_12534/g.27677  ORF Transcript_12534/g.27677 Transcript_12534/m.27677 type:complete len:306 (+) Transcript_12534:205-1122(+)